MRLKLSKLNPGESIDAAFAQVTSIVVNNPWKSLLGVLFFTVLLLVELTSIRIDTSAEAFLSPDSPSIVKYQAFKKQFGQDTLFFVLVEVDDPFSPDFVNEFRRFHKQLEDELPHIDRVDSLVNARHIYGDKDTLVIEKLLDREPFDPNELAALRQYALDNDAYENFLISKDHHLVTVVIRLVPFFVGKSEDGALLTRNLTESDIIEVSEELDQIVAEYKGSLSDDIQISGTPRMQATMGRAFEVDFGVFTGWSTLILIIILSLIFRRPSAVLMPLAVLISAALATFGTMALLDKPAQITTAILPSFIMVVCVVDSIHLLNSFYKRFDSGEVKQQALIGAMKHTCTALFFTSITTAAGLASFGTSSLSLVANLGIFAAFGTVYAFILTVIMLPALIMVVPLERREVKPRRITQLNYVISYCTRLATTWPKLISMIGILLLLSCSYLALQLKLSNNTLEWFSENDPTRMAMMKTQQRLGGSIPIEVIIDTGVANGAIEPALLNQLDLSMQEISGWQSDTLKVGKVIGLPDVLKEVNFALHNGDRTYYRVPDDKALIRQELLLLEMDAADSLYQLTDHSYRYLRTTILIPWGDAVHLNGFTEKLEIHFRENYQNVDITLTGIGKITNQAFVEMLNTTVKSYLVAFVVISLLMLALIGDIRIGLIAMVPNILPIVMALALMQILNIPLDMFTLMIGSIALGITVDDTVHFMHHFKRYYDAHGDTPRAISETLHAIGGALCTTTLTLASGFLVYTQSTLNNIQDFGLLIALCIVLALLADLLLAPALMMLMAPSKRTAPSTKGQKKGASRVSLETLQARSPAC